MNENERKYGAIIGYITVLLQLIIGFVYVPVLLRIMGQAEYGLYQLLGAIIGYFSILDFGLAPVITRFYTKYLVEKDMKKAENLLALAGIFYFIIAFIMLFIGIGVYSHLEDFIGALSAYEINESKKIFVILLINMILTIITNIFISVINAYERFLFLKGITLLHLVIQPFCVISVLNMYPQAIFLVYTQFFLNCLLVITRMYYCFYKLKIKIRYYFFDKELCKNIMVLISSVFFVMIADQIFWKTNQISIGIYHGTIAVAVYSIASMIHMNYKGFASAINSVVSTLVSKMVFNNSTDTELSQLFIEIGRIQYTILGLILSGFIVFGQEFVLLWLNSGYSEVYYITIIIMLPLTIDLIQCSAQSIMLARNNYWFLTKVYFILGIVNIFLVFQFANIYGLSACANISACLLFIANGPLLNWYYYRKLKLDIVEFWKNILQISLSMSIPVLFGIFLNFYINGGYLGLSFKIMVYSIVYFAIIWKFVLNEYEKDIIYRLR